MNAFAVLFVVFGGLFLGGALCLSLMALWSGARLGSRRAAARRNPIR